MLQNEWEHMISLDGKANKIWNQINKWIKCAKPMMKNAINSQKKSLVPLDEKKS